MLKPLVTSLLIALTVTACSFSRQASQTEISSSSNKPETKPIKFLENISTNPSLRSTASSLPDVKSLKKRSDSRVNPFTPGLYISNHIENSSFLQFKYAIMMQVAVEDLTNLRLLQFVDDWYATKYKYGGSSKRGIDCSAFTSSLLSQVFDINVPRTCREQFHATERIQKNDLQPGDLVFFSIRKGISHVGVYLMNNKFVHASVSSGVMISDLTEAYFSRRFAGAGRAIAAATAVSAGSASRVMP